MGQVIHIDDFKHEQLRANQLKCSIPQQYKCIGETLSICEVATIKIGIPWLPPSKERKILNSKFYSPLGKFIKTSLVTVSTTTLLTYCDDLNTFDSSENESLNIPSLENTERFYFCFVVFIVLLLSSTFVSLLLGSSTSAAIAVSIITALPASLLAVFPCLEVQRRASFYLLISEEIARRRGSDSTGTIGIVPQGT